MSTEEEGLPIAICEDCIRNNTVKGDLIDCPVLCDFCAKVTTDAWEAHRDKKVTHEEMAEMMHKATTN